MDGTAVRSANASPVASTPEPPVWVSRTEGESVARLAQSVSEATFRVRSPRDRQRRASVVERAAGRVAAFPIVGTAQV
jgi:hypothetical protein